MRRSLTLTSAVLCLALGACAGGADTGAGSDPTSDHDAAMGGDREQVVTPGVFPSAPPVPLRGTLRQDDRGCWLLVIDGDERLVALPPGAAVTTDGAGWRLADGTIVANGQAVDVDGAVVPAGAVPDVPDGYWGNQLAFCQPTVAEFVVVTAMAAAFDPASLSDAAWVDVLRSALVSVPHGCGNGFASTTSDRRVAIQLTPMARPTDRSPVTLPDDEWIAVVSVGKDLLIDNCDDAFEPWETMPIVHRTWPLTAGELVIDGTGPLPSCDGATVTGTLRAATVETDTGDVPLADVELVNDAYGCFAG